MSNKNVLQTFAARLIILALNFGLVIFTTNFWGSAGKGMITMVVADLTIVGFFANIFAGSSATYFAAKFGKQQVLFYAYIWAIVMGVLAPFLFVFSLSAQYFGYLIILSVLSSLLFANINFFVGQKKIHLFNFYSILQLAIHILFIAIFLWLFDNREVAIYFWALILSNMLLFLLSFFQIFKEKEVSKLNFSKSNWLQMFHYGWNTQFSSALQFLNYRLSYYFLEFFKGLTSVGIFSVGVAVSEAIWTVSRSIALVLYSEAVNSGKSDFLLQKTKIALKFSFLITFVFVFIALAVPEEVYTFVFGKEFHQTKKILLFLSPGILAIAASNVIGYYFAGINKLKILNLKSLIALVFTILLSWIFIPKFDILGACLVTTISHVISSTVLFWEFYRNTDFSIQDFLVSKSEIKIIFNRMRKR